jgi:hypothetical protein
VVPALHRNTIAFLGMDKRETYLATAMIKDKFIALGRDNYLTTWSVLSGKLMNKTPLSFIQDYKDYRIY